jgi:hypothetical protein
MKISLAGGWNCNHSYGSRDRRTGGLPPKTGEAAVLKWHFLDPKRTSSQRETPGGFPSPPGPRVE